MKIPSEVRIKSLSHASVDARQTDATIYIGREDAMLLIRLRGAVEAHPVHETDTRFHNRCTEYEP